MTTKLCVRCKWMNGARRCRHPRNLSSQVDPVDGTVADFFAPAALRSLEAKCGPHGEWYEPDRFGRVLDLLFGKERE